MLSVVPHLKGKIMHMSCRVREAENLNTTITFVRNSDQATVCSCEQRGGICSCDNTGYSDHICVCSANTHKTNSRYKDYTITKRNTNDQDVGVWLCWSDTLGWSKPRVPVIGKYK